MRKTLLQTLTGPWGEKTPIGERLIGDPGSKGARGAAPADAAATGTSLVQALAMAIGRALAAYGDTRVIPPPAPGERADPKKIKIGLYGNMANNFYVMTKGLRQMGYDAELVLQENGIDRHPLAQPFWEDVAFECANFEGLERYRDEWRRPDHVIRGVWDEVLQARFYGRLSAIDEVRALYEEHFERPISPDVALLLAQNMGHWHYLSQMKRFDVVLLSAAAMSLGSFAPCPFAVVPSGGDLTLAPFDESSLEGVLIRAAYRRSWKVLLGSPYWKDYLVRMDVLHKDVRSTLLLDTDFCAPGKEPEMRGIWHDKIGGSVFVHSTCRQDWFWKGNDKLLRAFARLGRPDMRLVLTRWGDDVERSESLIRSLGITDKVLWLPIGSKPVIRARQRAADIVVDQLVMGSFGTSVIESLAAGKPVVMKLVPPHMPLGDYQLPPVVEAETEEEVRKALVELSDRDVREAIGRKGRAWAIANRGFEARAEPLARELAEMVRR